MIRTDVNHPIDSSGTYLIQLAVGNVPVVVHVIDAERETQLGQFVALDAELRYALDELLEIDLSIAVGVENIDDTLHERILLQFRNRHELIDA